MIFKRFSAGDRTDVIERRDALFDPFSWVDRDWGPLKNEPKVNFPDGPIEPFDISKVKL